MKVGFSKICITPSLGTPISGYYEARYTKGVLDDLYVRALAFDNDKNRSLIIAVDNVGLSKERCDKCRKTISDYCNIPVEMIFINSSHTHTGPMLGKDFASNIQGSQIYEEYLCINIRDAAAYALEDVCTAKLYTAESKAEKISFIRRYRMKDGSVQTNPGVGNPNIDHALGVPNETVKLIKIERDGKDDVFVVNFGTHPDTIGGEYISADYPGFVCSTIEAAVPNTKCMFLLAPQGDVNHINPNPVGGDSNGLQITFDGCPRGYEHAKHMGRVIAGAVLQICGKATEIKSDDIKCTSKTITVSSNQDNSRLDEARQIIHLHETGRDNELPYKEMELTTVVAEATRILDLENGPMSYSFDLSAIKVGDLVFAGIPGEPFTEIANKIYANSPFDTTILCCLTNGSGGYFPTSSAYDEGGYEARTSHLKKGADDIVVNGALEMLNEL